MKIKSEIRRKDVECVEATIHFKFKESEVLEGAYWTETGEIFLRSGQSFDEFMGNFYDSDHDFATLSIYDIYIDEAPQYRSEISANSQKVHGSYIRIYTNKDIVKAYIKDKNKPIQIKKLKMK